MTATRDQEREWIRRAQAGDEKAFSLLVKEYYTRIMRVVSGLVRSREDVMDATQEVFVKAYRSIARFKGNSSFYTWLYRIAVNVTIDQHRRRAVRAAESVELEEAHGHNEDAFDDFHFRSHDMAGPGRVAENRELGELLFQAIEGLSDKHREVIILREIDGLSYEEIAATAGCSIGTVMSRLFHARKNVQKVMAPYYKEGGAEPDGGGR